MRAASSAASFAARLARSAAPCASRSPGFSAAFAAASAAAWFASSTSIGTSAPPRMDERMHVHRSDVLATTGMRSHMGENAKFMNVAGTHTFHSARRSSCMFAWYRSRACEIEGSSDVTTSFVM